MLDTPEKINQFKSLHEKGNPLVLYNIWDAGSARAVAQAGAAAIATGSWSVAGSMGFADGEKLPLDLALDNLQRIVEAVDLPVSIDLESGYSDEPAGVGDTVARAIEHGAVGFNLEDQIIGGDGLYDLDVQGLRIEAARAAGDAAGIAVFINARTDVFLKAGPDGKVDQLLPQVLERAAAFRNAGADGFFVPGLVDEAAIKTLCAATPLPVNILMRSGCPRPERLAQLGVARISHGPGPYRQAMQAISEAAAAVI